MKTPKKTDSAPKRGRGRPKKEQANKPDKPKSVKKPIEPDRPDIKTRFQPGNEIWKLAENAGRPSKYGPHVLDETEKYFTIDQAELPKLLPTIEGLAIKLGVHVDTIYEWEKVHPEFSELLKIARQVQKFVWVQNSLQGNYNSNFAKFYGMNTFGWSDKHDQELTINGIESILQSIHNG